MELFELGIIELSEAFEKGEASPVEAFRSAKSRIDKYEPGLSAFITRSCPSAEKSAKAAEAAWTTYRHGGKKPSALCGIPYALKDNLCVKGLPATCGSRMLENFVPQYSSTVASRLGGALLMGKTNMDEFAMGSSTENSAYGPTRNPWDAERVPGGSSGGSAAAVSAGFCQFALGSDTGGSIRQPAAFCGTVGLKPTYGRVSRYGLVAFGSSLDQIGPFTRSVEDAAIVLEAICGKDPQDSTTSPRLAPKALEATRRGVKGLKIGLPREYFAEGLDADVSRLVKCAVEGLEKEGAEIVEVSLPSSPYGLAAYYLCATAEASSNLARFDGIRYGFRHPGADDVTTLMKKTRSSGFGNEVKRRIMLGTYVLSAGYYEAYYNKALKVRRVLKEEFDKAFESCDVIAGPTTPDVAFRFGERTADPLSMYMSDIYTITANLVGLPAISIPCGASRGLPVGLQLTARAFGEETMFEAAAAVERASGFDGRIADMKGVPGR